MAAYLTSTDADTLAAAMPTADVSAYVAASTAQKTAALEAASERIDTAMRYQGRKYDLEQVLEFPRLAYGSGTIGTQLPAPPYPPNVSVGSTIWDWDSDANEAIVPSHVKRACLLEANSILAGTRDGRLDAIHDGLAGQSIGSASETYTKSDGAAQTLCRKAMVLMDYYRLRTGEMR